MAPLVAATRADDRRDGARRGHSPRQTQRTTPNGGATQHKANHNTSVWASFLCLCLERLP